MENNPLVTVNILSFNRKYELRNTLTKVYEQDYKNIEIIVIDNASTDGSADMVSSEFPEVILIKLNKNIGIAGWNKGFEIAKGGYVLVLDDDSYPEKDAIRKGVYYMNKNPQIGVVAYKIVNIRYGKIETENFTDPPKMFVGCGALILNKMLKEIGYFSEIIFIYYHELEFSARCYDAGFTIKYFDKSVIYHVQTPVGRNDANKNPFTSPFRYYHYFISFSIFLLTKFDTRDAIRFLGKWMLNRLIVALFYSYYQEYFKSLLFLIKNRKLIFKHKQPVNKKVQRFYQYGNHQLIDRLHFPKFKKPTITKIYKITLIICKNIISFCSFFLMKSIFKKKKQQSDGILFVLVAPIGDVVLSSVIFLNESLFQEKTFFILDKKYSSIYQDYSGSIKIISVNTLFYKLFLPYRIYFIRKIRKLKLRHAVNLNDNRPSITDEITILSGGSIISAASYESLNLLKIHKNIVNKYYNQVFFDNNINQFEKYNRVITIVTKKNPISNTCFFINEDKFQRALNILINNNLNNDKKFIIISPFASNLMKSWAIEKYIELIERILKNYNCQIVILGTKKYLSLFNKRKKNNNTRIINLLGKTTLNESAAIIKMSRIYIGNDSGLTHIAKALKKPFIGIIGGGSFNKFFPYDVVNSTDKLLYSEKECFGCEWKCKFDKAFCLTEVTVTDVMQKFNELYE